MRVAYPRTGLKQAMRGDCAPGSAGVERPYALHDLISQCLMLGARRIWLAIDSNRLAISHDDRGKVKSLPLAYSGGADYRGGHDRGARLHGHPSDTRTSSLAEFRTAGAATLGIRDQQASSFENGQ